MSALFFFFLICFVLKLAIQSSLWWLAAYLAFVLIVGTIKGLRRE